MMDYVATLLENHRLRVLHRRMEQMSEWELAKLDVSREQVQRMLRYGRPRPL